jgi:hypothetical protein
MSRLTVDRCTPSTAAIREADPQSTRPYCQASSITLWRRQRALNRRQELYQRRPDALRQTSSHEIGADQEICCILIVETAVADL